MTEPERNEWSGEIGVHLSVNRGRLCVEVGDRGVFETSVRALYDEYVWSGFYGDHPHFDGPQAETIQELKRMEADLRAALDVVVCGLDLARSIPNV